MISIKITRKYIKEYKIVAITYANEDYKLQLKFNKFTAKKVGKVDKFYSYTPQDIDFNFRKENENILSYQRGNGYWLWKPYFILKTLNEKLNYGDYLIYTDAGILYINKVQIAINFMISKKAEMWVIRLNTIEKHYTKRDAFLLLNADSPIYTDTYQFMAGIQIYKKTKFTEKFLEKLIYFSKDRRIITDEPNTLGLPNFEGFIENRHDQSVLSLLTKKFGLAGSDKVNKTSKNLNNFEYSPMPIICCIYRKTPFTSYYNLKNKCIEMNDIKFFKY